MAMIMPRQGRAPPITFGRKGRFRLSISEPSWPPETLGLSRQNCVLWRLIGITGPAYTNGMLRLGIFNPKLELPASRIIPHIQAQYTKHSGCSVLVNQESSLNKGWQGRGDDRAQHQPGPPGKRSW